MKILVADDDRITRALLGRWVSRWGYELVAAVDGKDALEKLRADPEIQICVIDWMMPEMNGPEVIRCIREERSEPYVYTVLLTAKTETDDVVEGLQSGADDYIHKPCHPLELEVRLRVGKRMVELQQSLIDARELLRFEATHDPLTHLHNRRSINDILQDRLKEARAKNLPLSVVMMDIDHFKAINDNHGHHIGDVVLREVPQRMRNALRAEDVAGRYGGEEFLLVLDDCPAPLALEVGEALRGELAARPVSKDGLSVNFTSSLGVACSDAFPRADAEALVRAADAALYRAKAGGRDRVSLAEPAEYGRPSLPVPGSAA